MRSWTAQELYEVIKAMEAGEEQALAELRRMASFSGTAWDIKRARTQGKADGFKQAVAMMRMFLQGK